MAMILSASKIAEDIETELDAPVYPNEVPIPELTPEKALAMPTDARRMSDSPSIEIYDSGCTRHMTPDRHRLINY